VVIVAGALGCAGKSLLGRRTYSKRSFESVAEALTTIRSSQETWSRRAAFAYLGHPENLKGGSESKDDVLGILILALSAEQDPQTRIVILESISRLDDSTRFEPIAPGLQDKDAAVREFACRLAGRTRAPAAAPLLANLLASDASLDVRLAAADALGQIPSRDSANALVAGIADPDVALRFRCEQSLKLITGKDLGRNSADWQQEIETVNFDQVARNPFTDWWQSK
jgi:HEAT repeat protein